MVSLFMATAEAEAAITQMAIDQANLISIGWNLLGILVLGFAIIKMFKSITAMVTHGIDKQ
jgi:hypothetical protein